MKKLRMTVTSAIVLAIVGSAFTYNAKKGSFCVTTNLSSTQCTTFTDAATQKIVPTGGTQFNYYPNWDGTPSVCTAPSNTLCTASFRLIGD